MELSISRIENLRKFQAIVGMEWKNIKLLNKALIHSSYANSVGEEDIGNNERMEFLGDAVLELVIADYLFKKYPELDEGDLSRLRSAIVSEENLAQQAREINLGDYLLVGKDQEEIKNQDAILADAYEAVIASIYLDRGLKAARKFIISSFIEGKDILSGVKDFKSLLQEYTQSVYKKLPKYQLVKEKGPNHKKMFWVKVKINGKTVGEGWGYSKKKAEKVAAEKAWERIRGDRKE